MDLDSNKVCLVFVNMQRDMGHFRRLFSELILIEFKLIQEKAQNKQHAPVQPL